MSTKYTVIVENKSQVSQEFYFFQQPAVYSGGPKVYTNSVGHGGLPPYKPGRTDQVQFSLLQQYYAGVQKQEPPLTIGQSQTGLVSQVEIDLAPSEGEKETKDATSVVIEDDSLYLTMPTNDPGVQTGAFRITTPTYTPTQHHQNIGLAGKTENGDILLSNFISAEPNKNTDVQPIVKFYVATGSFKPGTIVNFSTSSVNAALCDATDGTLHFNVTYNEDGTWSVN